jgi:hypothetical protein
MTVNIHALQNCLSTMSPIPSKLISYPQEVHVTREYFLLRLLRVSFTLRTTRSFLLFFCLESVTLLTYSTVIFRTFIFLR